MTPAAVTTTMLAIQMDHQSPSWLRRSLQETGPGNETLQQNSTTGSGGGEGDDMTAIIVENLYLSLPARIVACIIATVLAFISIGSAYFVHKYRTKRVVAVGQPPFLYMICFGTFLGGCSLYFTMFATEGDSKEWLDSACVAQIWFIYLGDITIYMALFSKLWRVKIVTRAFRRQTVLVRHVIAPLILAMLAAIGLLIAWTIDDPPTWQREQLEAEGNVVRTFGVCNPDRQTSNVPYDSILTILLTICVILALCMSCSVRKVPEDISDSKRVFQTLGTNLLLSICAAVLIFVAFYIQNFVLYYFAVFLVHVLAILATIGLLIFPKLYYVRYEQKYGRPHPAVAGRNGATGNVRVTGLHPPVLPTATVTEAQSSLHSNGNGHLTVDDRRVSDDMTSCQQLRDVDKLERNDVVVGNDRTVSEPI
jgi:7 transmembrane sweet-taste receptor of 3 GCPR